MDDLILGFAIGVVLVIFLLNWWATRVLQNLERRQRADVEESSVIEAKVEVIDGVYFFWSIKDGSFVAQGKNIDELLNHVKARWQDVHVKIIAGDKEVIQALKGQYHA